MTRRTLVIGDIHGSLRELEELLEKCNYQEGKDRLISVGDLVEKGPDSAGVLKLARRLKMYAVLGNHESTYLRFEDARVGGYFSGKIPTEAQKRDMASFSAEDWTWLRSLPSIIRMPEYRTAIIHGGAEPGIPLDDQDARTLLRTRFLDRFGKWEKSAYVSPPTGGCRWAQKWDGPECIIYGHAVNDAPVIDTRADGVWCAGIDTGCYRGRTLTALVMPSMELVQVPSRQPLWTPPVVVSRTFAFDPTFDHTVKGRPETGFDEIYRRQQASKARKQRLLFERISDGNLDDDDDEEGPVTGGWPWKKKRKAEPSKDASPRAETWDDFLARRRNGKPS